MKSWQRKSKFREKYWKKNQRGSFLNKYDFAYAGKDTVNQVGQIYLGIIKNATKKINDVAQQRINQIISQGGKEVEIVLPKIPWGTFEDTLQTARKFWKTTAQQTKNQNIKINYL